MSKWDEPEFAGAYAKNSQDVDMNWYEHEVNRVSVTSLIPKETTTLLDFGCGPGEFTRQMLEAGYEVDGCDASSVMVDVAHEIYPGIEFFVWDGESSYSRKKTYDTCVSVLALHFVDDLNRFAKAIHTVLINEGALIISVPHPLTTVKKAGGEYLNRTNYDTEIGSYGITVTMIHRSVQDYVDPFLGNGFSLKEIVEPIIPDEIIAKRGLAKEYSAIPRRLNLRFQKTA